MVKVLIICADRELSWRFVLSYVVRIATGRISSVVAINAKGNTPFGMLYAPFPVFGQHSGVGYVTRHPGHFTSELNLPLPVQVPLKGNC